MPGNVLKIEVKEMDMTNEGYWNAQPGEAPWIP